LLSFLKFDPAELFSVLAFMIFGPIPALVTATIHWIFLTATGQDSPLGPAAKFAAVLSTLLGMWLGSAIYGRVAVKHRHASLAFGSMLGFSALARVGVMLVVNYFVFTYLGPVIFGINYLGFSAQFLGMQSSGVWQVLIVMLILTSLFNALHVLFSVGLPFVFVTPLSLKIPEIASSHPWISRFNKG
jgi:riboflavin transporter FmnP